MIAGNIAGVYFSQNVVQRIYICSRLRKDQQMCIRDRLIGLETKSGRDYYTQKLSEQLQSLTQEEAAAVLSILETTIQQVKNLRNETV